MKYEILWLSEDKTLYSNYAKDEKELKRKLDYFINEKKLKLNNEDRINNIQVSVKIKRNSWQILSAEEVLNIIKGE